MESKMIVSKSHPELTLDPQHCATTMELYPATQEEVGKLVRNHTLKNSPFLIRYTMTSSTIKKVGTLQKRYEQQKDGRTS